MWHWRSSGTPPRERGGEGRGGKGREGEGRGGEGRGEGREGEGSKYNLNYAVQLW